MAGLAVVLVRRRTRRRRIPATAATGRSLDAAELAERRRFLDQSLADADAEYLAGDLSDKDYLALRRRDMARLAALEASAAPGWPRPRSVAGGVAVAESPAEPRRPPVTGASPATGEPAAAGRRARRGRRRWFLVGAVTAFGAALVVAVSLFATNRLPGQTATGSIASASPSRSRSAGPGGHLPERGAAGPGRPALPVGPRASTPTTRWRWPSWGGSSTRPGNRASAALSSPTGGPS